MRSLIRRLFPMHIDTVPGWRPKHRGRPALVARRPFEHQGATEDWSPKLAVAAVEDGEPEETSEEAALREAAEIVDHWAVEEERIAAEVHDEFEAVWEAIIRPLLRSSDDACYDAILRIDPDADPDELFSRAAAVAEPTGEYPIVRQLVTA